MSLKFNGTDSYIQTNFKNTVLTLPLTISCWIKVSSLVSVRSLVSVTNFTNGASVSIQYTGSTFPGQSFRVLVRDSGGSFTNATSSTTGGVNLWHHAVGVFASNTNRSIIVNASGKATSTGTRTASGFTTVGIGARFITNPTPSEPFNGEIANVGIWNAVLNDEDILKLFKGVPTNSILPENLLVNIPGINNGVDINGNVFFEQNQNVTISPHPRTYL